MKFKMVDLSFLVFVLLSLLLVVGLVAPVSAAAEQTTPLKDGQLIKIWPGIAPGPEGLTLQEEVVERSKDPAKLKDRYAAKILNPTLTVYLPEKPNGAAILVTPGGSYQRVLLQVRMNQLPKVPPRMIPRVAQAPPRLATIPQVRRVAISSQVRF